MPEISAAQEVEAEGLAYRVRSRVACTISWNFTSKYKREVMRVNLGGIWRQGTGEYDQNSLYAYMKLSNN